MKKEASDNNSIRKNYCHFGEEAGRKKKENYRHANNSNNNKKKRERMKRKITQSAHCC